LGVRTAPGAEVISGETPEVENSGLTGESPSEAADDFETPEAFSPVSTGF
jgi:hypothetical protein